LLVVKTRGFFFIIVLVAIKIRNKITDEIKKSNHERQIDVFWYIGILYMLEIKMKKIWVQNESEIGRNKL